MKRSTALLTRKLKRKDKLYISVNLALLSHTSEGIELLHDDEEKEVRRLYEEGNLCGISPRNYIMQTLIDPLLLDGHKFDFRVYLLVASTNPRITYFHEGVLWVSLHKFNQSATSKEGFVPTVSFAGNILKIAKVMKSSMDSLDREQRDLFNLLTVL